MSEINQIMGCDSSDKSILKGAESTAVLSSPYFGIDDDKFTDLFVKDYDYKDVSSNSGEGLVQIVLNGEGTISEVSFSGNEVPNLEIKSIFVQDDITWSVKNYKGDVIRVNGGVLIVEKDDGSVLRAVSAEITDRFIEYLSLKLLEYVETEDSSVKILKTAWEGI